MQPADSLIGLIKLNGDSSYTRYSGFGDFFGDVYLDFHPIVGMNITISGEEYLVVSVDGRDITFKSAAKSG